MITTTAVTEPLERYLAGLARDQLPFAQSKAVNDLAAAFQAAQKRGIQERFTVRRPWVLGHVRFDRGDRATKARPIATVRLEDPGSVFGGRSILTKFERGGRKLATEEGKSFPAIGKQLAIPIDAPTDASGVVQRAYTPTSLGLAAFKASKGSSHGTPALRGKRRTFVIPPGRSFGLPHGGILQRVGRKGGGSLRLLYVFRPSVPVPPRLEFYGTAQRVADQEWERVFSEAWVYALRTAI